MPTIEGTVEKIFTSANVFKQGPNKGKPWQRWGFKIDEETTIGTFDAKASGVVVEGNTYAFEVEVDEQGRSNLVKGTVPRLVQGSKSTGAQLDTGKSHVAQGRDTSIRMAVAMKAAVEYVSRRLTPVPEEVLAESLDAEMKLVSRAFHHIDGRLNWEALGEKEEAEDDTPF